MDSLLGSVGLAEIDTEALALVSRICAVATGVGYLRYLLFAGGAFLLFHAITVAALEGRRLAPRRVATGRAAGRQHRRDLVYSLSTAFVFGAVGALIHALGLLGWSRVYLDLGERGLLYAAGSLVALLLIHDTWFYWTHRLLHTRWLHRHVHRVHHLSGHPTPLTAFAFHPVEALIQAGFIFPTVLLLPLHPLVLVAFMLVQLSFNVLGHLGFELFPASFAESPLRFLLNTSTHHHQHHQRGRGNFGIYLNVWDRLCGTNDPSYQELLRASTLPTANIGQRASETVTGARDGHPSEAIAKAIGYRDA